MRVGKAKFTSKDDGYYEASLCLARLYTKVFI